MPGLVQPGAAAEELLRHMHWECTALHQQQAACLYETADLDWAHQCPHLLCIARTRGQELNRGTVKVK